MSADRRYAAGGFRSTLAFVMSLIALILSIMAYTSTEREKDLVKHIHDLQTKMEDMKHESAKQIDALRGDTANALDTLSSTLKKNGKKETN